jgi:FKBP-type peptidyl-prolyl cis-trans isomerase
LRQDGSHAILDISMNKQFIVAVVIGALVLVIFAYFIFGLNGSSLSQPSQIAPTQATDSGKLQIKDEKIGSGAAVKSGDTIVINYTGTLTNGTKFDSSYDRGQPFETQIGVGQVIKGWDEGVIGMKVGGKRKLIIPPSLGYGDQAIGSIPPNSTLIFEVELVGIK